MKPKTKAELTAKIIETWARISKEQCFKLVNSMPERCRLVIKNKRWPIKNYM